MRRLLLALAVLVVLQSLADVVYVGTMVFATLAALTLGSLVGLRDITTQVAVPTVLCILLVFAWILIACVTPTCRCTAGRRSLRFAISMYSASRCNMKSARSTCSQC